MNQHSDGFDLVLSYPQWQGSGRSGNLRRGADAAAKACGDFAPFVQVTDAGDGEDKNGINRWTALLTQFQEAQSLLRDHEPRRVLTFGGDCACDIAVIDYLNSIHPKLTVVWIDAHLDANTPATSPSGNLHGMPVAALLGHAPAELLSYMSRPLRPSQFRYVSAHVGDEGDWEFQRANALSWLRPEEQLGTPTHIHFDLDALDPSEFPHVAYPDGTLTLKAGLDLVRHIAQTECLVGLTVTEFSPVDDAAAKDGSQYIRRLCEAAGAVA